MVSRTVLCLDVGFLCTGVAIWDRNRKRFVYTRAIVTKKLRPSTAQDCFLRSQFLYAEISKIFNRFYPELVVAELPTGGAQNAKAMRGMALATAVVASFVAQTKVKFIWVTPTDIKRAVDPSGDAVSKEMVQSYVKARFGDSLLPKTGLREHIADAMVCIDVLNLA